MKAGRHDFVQEKQNYGCDVCGSRYHCAECGDGSGMLGHSMSDEDGRFFACTNPERAKAKWDKMSGRIK